MSILCYKKNIRQTELNNSNKGKYYTRIYNQQVRILLVWPIRYQSSDDIDANEIILRQGRNYQISSVKF